MLKLRRICTLFCTVKMTAGSVSFIVFFWSSSALFDCFLPCSIMKSRVHINYVISRYRSRIRRPCDIASPGDPTISYRNAHLARAWLASTDRAHILVIIISGTVISKAWIYCQSATGRSRAFQHKHYLICTLPTQHPLYSS